MNDRLILIDGNALVHRAYHAYPQTFTDPNGNPVGAIYGFFAMLLKIIQDAKPNHLIVCFDSAGPTFRQEMYVNYHAHRPALTNDFVPQLAKIQELLEEVKIKVFAVSGYEADDLIGTLSHQGFLAKDRDIIIVSGDRDLLQLVNSHVKVLMPITGITNMVLFDEKRVKEKYGVTPQQFIDYKALIGDNSDGYPGVTGIGPKTAASLISEFGSFENLYNSLDRISPKTSLKLATDAEQASLAKKLATIVTDAPIHLKLSECDFSNFDKKKLISEFEKFRFKSLIARWMEEEVNDDTKPKKKKGNVSEQLGLI